MQATKPTSKHNPYQHNDELHERDVEVSVVIDLSLESLVNIHLLLHHQLVFLFFDLFVREGTEQESIAHRQAHPYDAVQGGRTSSAPV